jgi:hypothetical protein
MINESIKEQPCYLTLTSKIRRIIKTTYSENDLINVNFLTMDLCGEEYMICLWDGEPHSRDEDYWSEDNDGSLDTDDIFIKDLTEQEKQFINDNWNMLIWQIAKGEENE